MAQEHSIAAFRSILFGPSQHKSNHLPDLPPEIWLQILENIDHQTLWRCRSVSHLFRDLAEELYRIHCLPRISLAIGWAIPDALLGFHKLPLKSNEVARFTWSIKTDSTVTPLPAPIDSSFDNDSESPLELLAVRQCDNKVWGDWMWPRSRVGAPEAQYRWSAGGSTFAEVFWKRLLVDYYYAAKRYPRLEEKDSQVRCVPITDFPKLMFHYSWWSKEKK